MDLERKLPFEIHGMETYDELRTFCNNLCNDILVACHVRKKRFYHR